MKSERSICPISQSFKLTNSPNPPYPKHKPKGKG